jgi:hypothetical protein
MTGRVTDDSGKPIVGALIRTKFINDIREARTDVPLKIKCRRP